MEPPGPHPTRKLAIENERLRLRIEALERLAAESRQAEEARREDEERFQRGVAERRRHEADVLGRLTSEINASLNLDTVLKCVAEGARELCGSDVVGIALRESGSDAMVFRFWSGVHGVVSLEIAKCNDDWVEWRPVRDRAKLLIDVLVDGLATPEKE